MASLSSIFPVVAGYNAGGIGLSREAKKCARPYDLARTARQERGIQTKQGDWFPQLLVDADLIPLAYGRRSETDYDLSLLISPSPQAGQ